MNGGKKFREKGRAPYNKPTAQRESVTESDGNVISGRNAVRELLESGRDIEKIYVQKGEREGSLNQIIAIARERKILIKDAERTKLDEMSCGGRHQGVVAIASEREYATVDDILAYAAEKGESPFVIILDGVEDPHNLGAIIRSADCSGAHGVIIPKNRAVGLTQTVAKSSAGAIEHMAIAKVTNIAATVELLKKKGVWVFAAEAGGDAYYDTDFNCATAIVLGSEGDGVSSIVKEKSDYIVSIPMYGKVNSLNVSTAAAVILSEVARQQKSKKN